MRVRVCLRPGGRMDEAGPPSQAQREPRCLLAQLPGERGRGSNGRSRTAFRLREQVTHCRYKPANQRPAQRCSQRTPPPRCSSAPQSSAPHPPARSHRPFNGLPGNETHLRHPSPPLGFIYALVRQVTVEKGGLTASGGRGWPGLVRSVPLSSARRRDPAEGGGGRCL